MFNKCCSFKMYLHQSIFQKIPQKYYIFSTDNNKRSFQGTTFSYLELLF